MHIHSTFFDSLSKYWVLLLTLLLLLLLLLIVENIEQKDEILFDNNSLYCNINLIWLYNNCNLFSILDKYVLKYIHLSSIGKCGILSYHI